MREKVKKVKGKSGELATFGGKNGLARSRNGGENRGMGRSQRP